MSYKNLDDLDDLTQPEDYPLTTYAECWLVIDEQGYAGRLWIERNIDDIDEIVYVDCEHSVCLWDDQGHTLTCCLCGKDVT